MEQADADTGALLLYLLQLLAEATGCIITTLNVAGIQITEGACSTIVLHTFPVTSVKHKCSHFEVLG
jgi:hypothetical protein